MLSKLTMGAYQMPAIIPARQGTSASFIPKNQTAKDIYFGSGSGDAISDILLKPAIGELNVHGAMLQSNLKGHGGYVNLRLTNLAKNLGVDWSHFAKSRGEELRETELSSASRHAAHQAIEKIVASVTGEVHAVVKDQHKPIDKKVKDAIGEIEAAIEVAKKEIAALKALSLDQQKAVIPSRVEEHKASLTSLYDSKHSAIADYGALVEKNLERYNVDAKQAEISETIKLAIGFAHHVFGNRTSPRYILGVREGEMSPTVINAAYDSAKQYAEDFLDGYALKQALEKIEAAKKALDEEPLAPF